MNKKLLRRGGGRCEGGKWNDKWSDVLGSLYCSSGRYVIFHGNPSSEEGETKTEGIAESVAVGDTILTSSGFYGVIIDMTDDTVIVEFGNNKNCRIPMQKAAIIQVEKPEA